MKCIGHINPIQSPPSIYHKSKEHLPSTCEKDGRGYTHLGDNKSCDHYEGPHNNPNNPAHHDEVTPLSLPPPEPPEPTSSHASSEPSEVEASISCDEPPCDSMDGTFVSMMALSSSWKETRESLEEQDSRGGGVLHPDETGEWRFQKDSRMGDCPKLPTMEH